MAAVASNRAFPYVTPELGAPEAEVEAPTLHITTREVSLRTVSRWKALTAGGGVRIHLTDAEAQRIREIEDGTPDA